MARPDVTVDMNNELAAQTNRPVFFFEATFGGSYLRLCSRSRDISWNTHTWQGNGWLNPFDGLRETANMESTGLQVRLTGLDQALIALILNDAVQSDTGKLWLGMLDASGVVIADPILEFRGYLDVPEISDDGATGDVIINYEDESVFLLRPSEIRWTDEAQRSLFPGDTGFRYTPKLEEWTGYWGRSQPPRRERRRRQRNDKKGRR